MKCPRCEHTSEASAKFCEECGALLKRACSKCGHQISPTANFCPECAHPTSLASTTPKHLVERILASKGDLEGERKQVTVLFADIVGSLEIIANRDPEEAQKLLDPVLDNMLEAVHRFEGMVPRVMGDGIMALFGAPLANEDHAVRACYSALRMQQTISGHAEEIRRTHGTPMTIRVGINSGEIVVSSINNDLYMDYTVVGQTAHLASRMERLAEPGTILLTPATLALAEDFVHVHSLGPRRVKGLSEPLTVYELAGATAVRSRFQAHAARGLSKFVGRTSEMAQLRAALDLAQGGRGQVVAVVGEPGVGKSRLFWEFAHSHRAGDCLVIEAPSVSYGKATTYLPITELLRGYFNIEARDDTQQIREKVSAKLLSLDGLMEVALPAILTLLEVPVDDEQWKDLDPPARRQRTIDAIRLLLIRESQKQPLVVMFENLHWIDAESQSVLNGLVESLPSGRILLLVNYRPEYQHAWGNKSYYQQLRIDPLPSLSAEELLRTILGDDPRLRSVHRLLIARTEGNPFFLEESVRALVEAKVLVGEPCAYRLAKAPESVQIPATAQAILATRIDRLEPEDKRLLQAASVIGKIVPLALLEAVADTSEGRLRQGLARLQSAELLYQTRLFPEIEYTFKHALTHEVTYSGLVRERRRELHARIVGAIEMQYGDRLGEHIERLAHHALCGQLREKGVHYLRLAGLRAAAHSALEDARVWFEQALNILKTSPKDQYTAEQAFEIRLQLWPVLVQLGEVRQQLKRLQEAEVLAEELNDEGRRGRVCASMTNILSLLGELDEAVLSGTRALDIAEQRGDLRLRILTTTYLEQAHYLRAEYERVVELATNNLVALPADRVYELAGIAAPVSVFDRRWLVMSLAELGRFADAAQYGAEAIEVAERTQHAFTIGLAHGAAGTLYLVKGDWAKALALVERATAVLRAGNIFLIVPHMVASSAWALIGLGESSEAMNRVREGERLVERWPARGIVGERSWVYCLLGRTWLALGELEKARRLGDRAVESAPRHPGFAAHALNLIADIAAHPDRLELGTSEEYYRKALALAEPRGMRPLVAHSQLGLGKVYRCMGKRQEAREHLTMATMLYREMGMAYYLESVEEETRESAQNCGR
jgi:class 3 adenylate cyclase/tetratricopeptide (TPR) repeat protein